MDVFEIESNLKNLVLTLNHASKKNTECFNMIKKYRDLLSTVINNNDYFFGTYYEASKVFYEIDVEMSKDELFLENYSEILNKVKNSVDVLLFVKTNNEFIVSIKQESVDSFKYIIEKLDDLSIFSNKVYNNYCSNIVNYTFKESNISFFCCCHKHFLREILAEIKDILYKIYLILEELLHINVYLNKQVEPIRAYLLSSNLKIG